MCGIIGFIGNDALNGILNGLELLEYRGYDSAGFAIRRAGESLPEIHKCQGRVKDLREISPKTGDYTCGIGHTRWATHGGSVLIQCASTSCGKSNSGPQRDRGKLQGTE